MGSVQARAHIFIQVEDSNNHSPTFEKSFEEIETFEETPIGKVVSVIYVVLVTAV